jgi:hypothetical protein
MNEEYDLTMEDNGDGSSTPKIRKKDTGDSGDGCLGLLFIIWAIGIIAYWISSDLFSSTEGRIGFCIIAFLSYKLRYYIVNFLMVACSILFIFLVGGFLIGWIFDIKFFEKTLDYINIFVDYLAK